MSIQGNVRVLKDKDGNEFFPVTHAKAIYSEDGLTVEQKEEVRQDNETQRISQFNDILEYAMLSETDNGVLSITTEYDAQNRMVKKNFIDSQGILRRKIERIGFNAQNKPLTLKNKLYDSSGYGSKYYKHDLTYGADNGVSMDTVTIMPSEVTDLSITRSGIATDPLQSYSPASAPTTFNNNVPVLLEQDGTPQLTNNESMLEIHGNKAHETFKTDNPAYEDKVRRLFVGGDTATYDYDFGLKVANSVAECPMKLYSGLIDPANPPAPSYQVTNMVTNGNFTNTSNWTTEVGTMVASNQELQFTVTASGSSGRIYQIFTKTIGNKYYVSADIKRPSALQTSLVLGSNTTTKTVTANTYTKVSGILIPTDTGSLSIYFNNASANEVDYVKNVLCIDLTATFGAGKEPTLAECDSMFSTWFNGTVTHNTYWKEVTSQSVIDRVKAQNELNITSVDTTGRTAVINGQTLVQQGTNNPAVRDDFKGKVSGDTTGNPNKFSWKLNSSLQPPSSFTMEYANTAYDIGTQGDGTASIKATNAGEQPQALFSFNIIRMVEDKYGLIPVDRTGTAAEVLVRQIDWLKNNLSKIIAIGYVYGVCPTGNKACFARYVATTSAWSSPLNNTANSPTSIQYITSDMSTTIDPQGMVHFLAYTDPARTTDSTLLVLTGHGLSLWDLVENVPRGLYSNVSAITANTIVTSTITGQQPGDSIKKYRNGNGAIAQKVITAINGSNVTIVGHGLSTTDNDGIHFIKNNNQGFTLEKVKAVDANTLTMLTSNKPVTVGDVVSFYPYFSTQTAESTVIQSTIYSDYVSLDIQLKATAGYDVLVPQNPRRDAGLGYSVQLQKVYGKQTSDFKNKIQASITENPNIAKCVGDTTLKTPSAFAAELGTSSYGTISSQDNSCWTWGGGTSKSAAGYIDQQLFSFDIIAKFEKDYGTIPITLTGNADTDKANKIAWLKSANGIKTLTAKWYGYGSCPSGNKAILTIWKASASPSAWDSDWIANKRNTASTPSMISGTMLVNENLDSNGFVHFLAYTDAATLYNTVSDTDLWMTAHGLLVPYGGGDSKNDIIENTTRNAFGTIDSLSGNRVTLSQYIHPTGQVAGDNIKKYHYNTMYTLAAGTTTTVCKTTGAHNLKVGDVIRNSSGGDGLQGSFAKVASVTDSYTFTLDRALTDQAVGNTIYSYTYYGQQAAENDGTPSTIYTDYISLDIEYNAPNNSVEYFTNNSVELESLANAKAQAYLVETDMTALCTALAGGSNSAFKSLLKSIQADVWAMGSGANAGVLGYGAYYRLWADWWNLWAGGSKDRNNNSTTGVVQKILQNDSIGTNPSGTPDRYIVSSNKLYILIHATYPSDGTIPSQVSLDYIKLTLQLTRQPDVVAPISVQLPKNWAMLVKGFSPNWDNTDTPDKRITSIYDNSNPDANYFDVFWSNTNKKYVFRKCVNNNIVQLLLNNITTKNKVCNFLIGQHPNGMFAYMLPNNDVLSKYTNSDNNILNGAYNLRVLMMRASSSQQADAFTESFRLFDLDQLGKPTGFTDAEALAYLNGTQPGYENPNLVDMSKITLHPNATYDKATNTITLNATDKFQTSTIYVPVLPNNRYVVLGSMTGVLSKREYYNSINVVPVSSIAINTAFVTGNNTNRLQLNLTNSASGTFTFKDIELRRKD